MEEDLTTQIKVKIMATNETGNSDYEERIEEK